jgi:hypothetical protein
VLVDGVGARALADGLVDGLLAAGRPPVRVSAGAFLRPAGERYEHGREDAQDFRERWLDAGALRREVLDAAVATPSRYLPALWDAARDRSARARVLPLPERAVLVVDGRFLLDHDLPAELVVHLALSPAALRRRGVPDWQLEAFADYDRQARPGEVCDVLVRAEDPARPAVLLRQR